MSNFDKYTNYRNDAGVSGVVFGAEKTVLEVELNEMQEISKNMLRDLIKNVIGDGITDISKITYKYIIIDEYNKEFILDEFLKEVNLK